MTENRELAPIVLFVYNRLDHTRQTIEALKKNTLAKESQLFIYSDGAKDDTVSTKVQNLREYLKGIDGFNKVTIIERDRNWGLAPSIIDGVSSIIEQYGKVIVLEDDLITSKYFLEYMNDALEAYQSNDRVFSITGFSFHSDFMNFPSTYKDEVYLNIRPMSWSWATWKNRWGDVDWDVSDFKSFINDPNKVKEFNKGGTDLTRMLKNQMKGRLNSWYVRWTYHAYKKKMYTIYPRISYVNNIGHDSSGVHCVEDSKDIYSHHELNDNKTMVFNKNIGLNKEIVRSFNKGFNTNYVRILKRKMKKIFNKFKV